MSSKQELTVLDLWIDCELYAQQIYSSISSRVNELNHSFSLISDEESAHAGVIATYQTFLKSKGVLLEPFHYRQVQLVDLANLPSKLARLNSLIISNSTCSLQGALTILHVLENVHFEQQYAKVLREVYGVKKGIEVEKLKLVLSEILGISEAHKYFENLIKTDFPEILVEKPTLEQLLSQNKF